MREEHPIDERFKALHDAEATPPEAVHEALAARMGWNGGAGGGAAWKPWLMAASALVVVGLGVGLWTTNNTFSSPSEVAAIAASPEQGSSPSSTETTNTHVAGSAATTTVTEDPSPAASTKSLSTTTGETSPASETSRPADAQERSTVTVQHTGGTAGPGMRSTKPDHTTASAEDRHAGQERSSEHSSSATSTNTGTSGRNMPANTPPPLVEIRTNETYVDPSARTTEVTLDEAATRLPPLPPLFTAVGSGTPKTVPQVLGYLLPRGTWWIGPYVGIGSVSGEWRGDGSSALGKAEQWRSTAQAGLLVGREWRSGWGISAGLGLARVRSTFNHESRGSEQEVTVVDTSWVENFFPNATSDIIYTWTIDSLVDVRPGAPQRADSRNLYTAVQVPFMLSWHGDVRRLRYGAFGGLTAWIPTSRKGLTLVQENADAAFSTTSLDDARVNDRFSAQLHGQFGLSLGYSFTEHLSAYAEPLISMPLLSFNGGDVPWLTRPLLQIRLQHEFASKAR